MKVDILKVDLDPSIRDEERIRINKRKINDILFDLSKRVNHESRITWSPVKKWTLSKEELYRSFEEDGAFHFWICGCGEPGCLGERPTRVLREADNILWQISLHDRGDEVTSEIFRFHLPQYKRELSKLWDKAG